MEDEVDKHAKSDFSRRHLLKGSVGATALALGGGTPFMNSMRAYAAAADLSKEQLRTIGLSVTVQDRILADFQKASGVGSDGRHGGDLSRTRRPRSCPARATMIAGR